MVIVIACVTSVVSTVLFLFCLNKGGEKKRQQQIDSTALALQIGINSEMVKAKKEASTAYTKTVGEVSLQELAEYMIDKKPIVRPVGTVVLATEEESGNGN